ncbi:putative Jade-1 protein [Blattamonas nauphoetae]|uniref:Jade-1 protein n=1 Tax=Blattamonas nauphoetae TaxID=2049346 RepID=A0ABQ9XRT3_9EUKA|nr:putative Jade-1 protein [Blattamonas nauphoetae]
MPPPKAQSSTSSKTPEWAPLDVLDDEVTDDDVMCSVCGSYDSSDVNPIILCDGCQCAVHPRCYAVTDAELEKDTWLCRPCSKHVPPRTPKGQVNAARRCSICEHLGGALSEVSRPPSWVHTSCVVNFPELTFVDGCVDIQKLHPSRFAKPCYICSNKDSATLCCSYVGCSNAFHGHCGVRNNFIFETIPHPSRNRAFQPVHYCKEHGAIIAEADESSYYVFYDRQTCCVFVADKPDSSIPVDVDAPQSLRDKYPYALPISDIEKLKALSRDRGSDEQFKNYDDPYQALSNCLTSFHRLKQEKKASYNLTVDYVDPNTLTPHKRSSRDSGEGGGTDAEGNVAKRTRARTGKIIDDDDDEEEDKPKKEKRKGDGITVVNASPHSMLVLDSAPGFPPPDGAIQVG